MLSVAGCVCCVACTGTCVLYRRWKRGKHLGQKRPNRKIVIITRSWSESHSFRSTCILLSWVCETRYAAHHILRPQCQNGCVPRDVLSTDQCSCSLRQLTSVILESGPLIATNKHLSKISSTSMAYDVPENQHQLAPRSSVLLKDTKLARAELWGANKLLD